MTEMLALTWLAAEERATKAPDAPLTLWKDIDELKKAKIRGRVQDVLEGYVSRKDMSPGDLAIYQGRSRCSDLTEDEQARLRAFDPKKHEGIRRFHVWDSFDPFDLCGVPTVRLFGNVNVGNMALSTMQCANFLSDRGCVIKSWHLESQAPSFLIDPIERLLSYATVTLSVCDMPRASDKGLSLWREPRPIQAFVPPRHSMYGQFEFHYTQQKNESEWSALHRYARGFGGFRFWLHLEGWRSITVV